MFDDILHAVQSVKSTLDPKIDALCIGMGHLREEDKRLKERVASAEGEVAELRPPLAAATQHVTDLQREVLRLHQWLEDQEGRACRNNIRVVGLPEQEGSPNMDLYMEQWLAQTVLQGKQSSFFSSGKSAQGGVVRGGATRTAPGARRRPLPLNRPSWKRIRPVQR
ncbi:hypothetical protein NDU88_002116 [Pleurodeles waltl]|uniref:Uncharacterized protein n=1 Tax=Pleurodeles waltl TaxID=8319 RepID=A0AAV7U8S5_PLEWA|nr:hypothetical protein NDU88_002116 [Pleurodeles waltl]